MPITTKSLTIALPPSDRLWISTSGITAFFLALSLSWNLLLRAIDAYASGRVYFSAATAIAGLLLVLLATWCLYYASNGVLGRQHITRKLVELGFSAKQLRNRGNAVCYLTAYGCLATYLVFSNLIQDNFAWAKYLVAALACFAALSSAVIWASILLDWPDSKLDAILAASHRLLLWSPLFIALLAIMIIGATTIFNSLQSLPLFSLLSIIVGLAIIRRLIIAK